MNRTWDVKEVIHYGSILASFLAVLIYAIYLNSQQTTQLETAKQELRVAQDRLLAAWMREVDELNKITLQLIKERTQEHWSHADMEEWAKGLTIDENGNLVVPSINPSPGNKK